MGKHFLDDEGFLWKKKPKSKILTVPLEREVIEPVYFTDDELYYAKGSVLLFDLEIYPNYFLAAFKQYIPKNYDKKTIELVKNGEGTYEVAKVVTFELYPDLPVFNASKLLWVMHNFCLVGFNSIKFDNPILNLALQGASLDQIYEAVEKIIKYDAQPYDIEAYYGFKSAQTNNIDLIEVAPLSASLKLYGGRLHAPRLQDLPFDPATYLDQNQVVTTRFYCVNDLDLTGLLLYELEPQLNLRAAMGLEYKLDLRSKSDAQVAEAVICSEIKKITGSWPKKPKISEGFTVNYQVPEFIKFKSAVLNDVLNKFANATFELDALGSPMWPIGLGVKEKTKDGKDKWVLKIQIGNSIYKIGMGGLHSSEKSICHVATEDIIIEDNDVESYYPRIILNQRLAPEHLKEYFITVYNSIVERRLEAKHLAKKYKKEGNRDKSNYYKRIADSLKIVINGSFGKLGSKYSALYAPQLMLQVTISGQLALLMLIEKLEEIGINVISGNTDGIILKYNKARKDEVKAIIKQWEIETCFKTEETRYYLVASRDVNDYYAVKLEGGDNEAKYLDERLGVKTKGVYCERGSALNSVLSKNPDFLICTDAVQNFLVNGIPIDETIKNCTDITRFTTLRTVKGGAEKNGVYLGKVVRYYYAHKETGCINYVLSGNKVPSSDGAKPLMDLPKLFPTDIDYDKYVQETIEILYDIGYLQKPKQAMFF